MMADTMERGMEGRADTGAGRGGDLKAGGGGGATPPSPMAVNLGLLVR